MTACDYCGDAIAMPYTCSLCGNRYCGKHRLAESHDCVNKSVYRDPSYAKKKLRKNREMQHIKAGRDPNTGKSQYSQTRGGSSLRSFWEADKSWITAVYGGMILGLAIGFQSLIFNISLGSLRDLVLFVFIGGLGFLLVNSLRQRKAKQVSVFTSFKIWPVGIFITLITSIFGFTFYAFGFFTSSGSSIRSEAEVAKNTIYSFAGLFIVLKLSGIIGSSVFANTVPTYIFYILSRSSTMFLFFGLIMTIPWSKIYGFIFGRGYPSIVDGDKLYDYNTGEFWYHFIGLILLYIFSFINWTSILGL